MDTAAFAHITRRVIADDGGLDKFLPVACYPARREIRALEGLPAAIDLEVAVLEWARKGCDDPNEECLVAFRHTSSEFKIVRFVGAAEEHEIHVA
jgi:hypothetical protein